MQIMTEDWKKAVHSKDFEKMEEALKRILNPETVRSWEKDIKQLEAYNLKTIWKEFDLLHYMVKLQFFEEQKNKNEIKIKDVNFLIKPKNRKPENPDFKRYNRLDIFNEITRNYPFAYPILGLKPYSEITALNKLENDENFKVYIEKCNIPVTKEKAARLKANELFNYIFGDEVFKENLKSVNFRRKDDRVVSKTEKEGLNEKWEMKGVVKCNITRLPIWKTNETTERKVGNPFALDWDHRIPYSRNGPKWDWNLQPLCAFINQFVKQRACKNCDEWCYKCILAFPEKETDIMSPNVKDKKFLNQLFSKKKGYKNSEEFNKGFESKFKTCSELIKNGNCTPSMKTDCPCDKVKKA